MDIRYDIGRLIREAFGINSPVYIIRGRQEVPAPVNYPGVRVVTTDEAVKLSDMGTPIVFPVTFKGGTYQVYNAKGELAKKEFADFVLPAATLVDFSRAKNIARTNVLGNNGTVKEIYGFDDWSINLRMVCLPERDRTAAEQKEILLEWEQVAASFVVEGELFTEKNIFALAIQDINIRQVQGKPEVIPIDMRAMSDEPLELILNENML
ncbi:DUF6046 domain-containing protein [Sinomicrobium kalidii]|uniref:DUF6046 domain-containing protein n=1 Tax=Sinomicrobium kalidii TaxID=2900738 RepID=UPI001E30A7D3|nr:DUF6046 domain-containing protein [Sinomicrobium kalidii]UGU15216.1 DUF6046 domain-containing protein [Sinomicrobium kalidii]